MKRILIFLFITVPLLLWGQSAIVKGIVTDAGGSPLPFANMLILPDSQACVTAASGVFSFTTKPGLKNLSISYTGFQTLQLELMVEGDTSIVFSMISRVADLRAIVIDADRFSHEDHMRSTRSGTNFLTPDDIHAIPVLGGEADLIKTLQLMPGTLRGVEGSADLFVRGGAADQNLVLLDDAPIYNTSHLFGFLSVFNPDILSDVEAINGGFPAEYGGRLSSILNVRTRNRIPGRTTVSGDVGLIASRLFVEQPIVKDKVSIWLAGRRTYIDRVVRAVGEELPYHFYDLNAKIIFTPSQRDRIELSHYQGDDILDLFRDRNNDGRGFLTTYASGNSSQSLKWRHRTTSHWSQEIAAVRTSYRYKINNIFEENSLSAFSDIEDYRAKLIISRDSLRGSGSLKSGLDWTRHAISPNIISASGTVAQLLESSTTTGKVANEFAAFAQYESDIVRRLKLNIGFRGSLAVVEGRKYFTPEPRLALRFALKQNQAFKASYSRMAQYMHRISNSAISTPTDVWYPVTQNVRPQTGHQFSLAWQRFDEPEKLYFSAETYYKEMNDVIGYEEGTNLFFNPDFESKLVQGLGRAYGFELLIKKNAGRFTGWISYTLSWSWRQFDRVNSGVWFPARYDRRHNGAVVAQYTLGRRWLVSGVWEFISGSKFTPVIGQYAVLAPTLTGFDLIPMYSGVNAVKLADAHRLDLGLKFLSNPQQKFRWQWFAGVYNVYNRATPIGILIEQNEADGSLRYMQPGLFGMLPFLSYGFKI